GRHRVRITLAGLPPFRGSPALGAKSQDVAGQCKHPLPLPFDRRCRAPGTSCTPTRHSHQTATAAVAETSAPKSPDPDRQTQRHSYSRVGLAPSLRPAAPPPPPFRPEIESSGSHPEPIDISTEFQPRGD